MITFREWLKLKEDENTPDPMGIQKSVAQALNPPPNTMAINPNAIANQFVQKMSKPVLAAVAANPVMKKFAAANQLQTKNTNAPGNNPNMANYNQVMQPNVAQNPITPMGSNFN